MSCAGERAAGLRGRRPLSLYSWIAHLADAPSRFGLRRFASALMDESRRAAQGTVSLVQEASDSGACAAGRSAFPALVPFPFAGTGRLRGGSRDVDRAAKRRAKLWVNWLYVLFSYWESGTPHSRANVESAISRAAATSPAIHRQFSKNLFEDVLPFCRSSAALERAGRGIKSLAEQLSSLSSSLYSFSSSSFLTEEARTSKDPRVLATVAQEVNPERISIPEVAATCDPLAHLYEPERSEFRNMKMSVAPTAPPLPGWPRPCHMVVKGKYDELLERLLESGMVRFVEDSQIPRDTVGRALAGGLFVVPHKADRDRLINDRRPCNSVEGRLGWARLPHGCQLLQLVVEEWQTVVASGDDLSNYFYCLKHLEEWIPRNAFGPPVSGEHYTRWGCRSGTLYRPCFRAICMGDLNAVDIAHTTHEHILRRAGCMLEQEAVRYRVTTPPGNVWEFLYIDDHWCVSVISKASQSDPASDPGGARLLDIMSSSRAAYVEAQLPRAAEKSADLVEDFVVIGTEVSGKTGRVGTPLDKRRQISLLVAETICLGHINKKGLQKLLGLVVHPFSHRKCLMASLHSVYAWLESLDEGPLVRIPPEVQDELLAVVLLLP